MVIWRLPKEIFVPSQLYYRDDSTTCNRRREHELPTF